MARDQFPISGDEAGNSPAKFGHAGGNLRHLFNVVALGIPGVGPEARKRPVFDPAGQEGRVHATSRLALRAAKLSPVSARTAS